jgi:dTDP-glucose 4,6-dehydratase
MTRVLVTGGAGFIGAHFVRDLLAAEPATEVAVLDKMTYAADAQAIEALCGEPRFAFAHGCIGDRDLVRGVLDRHRPDAIVHFAAETHVDRSIDGPADFIDTNVVGTFKLLEETRRYLAGRGRAGSGEFRFVHVSTDEVFGALGATGCFVEDSRYAPRSPYSASKAASDHLVASYVHTYGLPALTTNCSNNYGPYQFPEKLIPLMITSALAGDRLPVYGAGENVRDWIYVSDHCAAVRAVLRGGQIGETYLIGARAEQRNLDVVHTVCDVLDELQPRACGTSHRALIQFVTDRPGHDFRYAIDPSKIERELGWRPEVGFAEGIRRTVAWFIAETAWIAATRARGFTRATR